MKKTGKLLLVIMMFCITLLFSDTAKAADKEYSVLNADFYVQLQENGNAMVTETWEIEYEKGSFTRFYKDIYKDVTAIEKFTNVEVLSCKINGKEAEETDYVDRVDYHFYFEDNSDTYRIHWFLEAEDEIVTYEITYLLEDIVKENADGKAVFCYRFVGEEFEENIKNTSTTIELPWEGDIEVSYSKADEQIIDGNIVVLKKSNVRGILKYGIETTAEMFENLIYTSAGISEEGEVGIAGKIGIGVVAVIGLIIAVFSDFFWVAILVLFIGVIIISIRQDRKKQKEFEEIFRNNPYYFTELADKYVRMEYHPLLIGIIANRHVNAMSCFRIMILELCRKGKADISKNEIIVSKNRYGIQFHEEKMLQLMERTFCPNDYGNVYGYSLSVMKSYLRNKKNSTEFQKAMAEIYLEFMNAMMLGSKGISHRILLCYCTKNQ